MHTNPALYPLQGWNVAPGAVALPAPPIDLSQLPAGVGGDYAYVDAFLLDFTITPTFAGGSAAVQYQNLAQVIAGISLDSKTLGPLFGVGLTGTDLYNVIQPYMGFGPDGSHPIANGIAAAGGAVTRNFRMYLPFENRRRLVPKDTCHGTQMFRGDSIIMQVGATTALGANTTIANVICQPYAVLSSGPERKVSTVAHWLQDTSANATIVAPGRAYGFFGLMSNLVGLNGAGAVSAYTNINVARGDLFRGLGITAEQLMQQFRDDLTLKHVVNGFATGQGAAGSSCWPYNPAAAVAVTGLQLDPQSLFLPIIWEKTDSKLSQLNSDGTPLEVQTQGLAGTHRYLAMAYAEQTTMFEGRVAGLYGMSAAVARPKLAKPPREARRGVKEAKTRFLPRTLGQ